MNSQCDWSLHNNISQYHTVEGEISSTIEYTTGLSDSKVHRTNLRSTLNVTFATLVCILNKKILICFYFAPRAAGCYFLARQTCLRYQPEVIPSVDQSQQTMISVRTEII